MHKIVPLCSSSLFSSNTIFIFEVGINSKALIGTLSGKVATLVIRMTHQATMEVAQTMEVNIDWKTFEDCLIDLDCFYDYVLGVCTRVPWRKKRIGVKIMEYVIERVSVRYHPVFGWEVKFVP